MNPWAVVEELDEFEVCVALHVLPVKEINNKFDTKEEAEEFNRKMEELGDPIIMDEDGDTMLSYFGHTLSKDCQCQPRFEGGINNVYVHKHNA